MKKSFNFCLLYFLRIWGILFILLFCLQLKAQEKHKFFSCGTQIDPDAYTSDIFYGDNQKLVELLIDHNVDIDIDYLKQLEEAKDISKLGEGVFKEIGIRYDIPIKAWKWK